jgi:energy-coupling factor transport system ATP-binding protein
MSQPLISVQHLTYIYPGGNHQPALQDVNLEITAGSCAAIIGVTGSGKSTLVQHLNGLLLPTSGSVFVDGLEIGVNSKDLTKLRQRVGMLFQQPENQLFAPTVYEDVAFGPRRLKLPRVEMRHRVLQALENVGLPPADFARRSPFALSGGQRRRVALAGVLAMGSSILILDEPGVGLDAAGRAEIYTQIRALLHRGLTVILISHDMAEVAEFADQLFVLHHGKLVLQGQPRAIFAQPAALRSYGLAPPPLSSLLQLLRQRGLEIPGSLTTVDEVFEFVAERHNR